MARCLRLTAWLGALLGAHVALQRTAPLLPGPAPGTDVLAWLQQNDPVLTAFARLRARWSRRSAAGAA